MSTVPGHTIHQGGLLNIPQDLRRFLTPERGGEDHAVVGLCHVAAVASVSTHVEVGLLTILNTKDCSVE